MYIIEFFKDLLVHTMLGNRELRRCGLVNDPNQSSLKGFDSACRKGNGLARRRFKELFQQGRLPRSTD